MTLPEYGIGPIGCSCSHACSQRFSIAPQPSRMEIRVYHQQRLRGFWASGRQGGIQRQGGETPTQESEDNNVVYHHWR